VLDPIQQLTVPGLDAAQALHDHPEVERHHQRDQRLRRQPDDKLTARLLERLRQHRPPLGIHPREALGDVRVVPGQRLQLQPDLLVADILAH